MSSNVLSAVPPSSVRPTGAYNFVELGKFLRLVVVWLALIFTPVWLVCWAVGEFVPEYLLPAMLPPATAAMTTEVLRAFVPVLAVMVFIPINAMFMVLCERRALALFTVRKGPNRVGVNFPVIGWFLGDGMLQTAADAVKLLFKEDITPDGADPIMFTLAPIIFFAPSIFGAIPLLAAATYNHPLFATAELPTGIFYILAMASIPVVALVMGGWSSNNKYSLVGGLRAGAQAISYEIPLVLSLITMCYLMGTLNVSQIGMVQSVTSREEAVALYQTQTMKPVDVFSAHPPVLAPQSPGILQWNVFGNGHLDRIFSGDQPTQGLAAILITVCSFLLLGIYMIGACAEINRIPFDLPEAESELVSGYNTEYSGIKFAIFFLAEFTNLFIVATIASVMFLGAGASPIPYFFDAAFFQHEIFMRIGSVLSGAPELARFLGTLLNPVTLSAWFWLTVKVYSIVLLAILVRGTLPRFRIDQLMDFGWKRLIPLSLFLFLACAFLKEML